MAPEGARPALAQPVAADGQPAVCSQKRQPRAGQVHQPQWDRKGELGQSALLKKRLGQEAASYGPLITDTGLHESPFRAFGQVADPILRTWSVPAILSASTEVERGMTSLADPVGQVLPSHDWQRLCRDK